MDYEEVVETTEELLPPQANVGHVEQSALTVEVSDGLVEIEDLTPTLWLQTEDIAIVRNFHSTSGYNLLAVVDETVPVGLGGSSNFLSSSSDSVYEDAQAQVSVTLLGPAPEGRGESERGAETVPLLPSYTVETDSLHIQLRRIHCLDRGQRIVRENISVGVKIGVRKVLVSNRNRNKRMDNVTA